MALNSCIQCGRCSASCPVSFVLDLLPHQMVRLLQLKTESKVLTSEALWLCIQCGRCTNVCPQEVDLAGRIQELRVRSRTLTQSQGKEQRRFHRIFLRSLERNGRVYDAFLLFRLLHVQGGKNWKVVWPAFVRGKIRIWPSRMSKRLEIKGYFKRAFLNLEGKHV